jgi:hypothetical protein
MLARLEQHPLQEHAVGGLHLSALGDGHPGRVNAISQLVTDPLELSETEDPRFAPALRRLVETAHPIRGDERLRELALEALDLGPQGAARGPLIDFGYRRRWSAYAVLKKLHDSSQLITS